MKTSVWVTAGCVLALSVSVMAAEALTTVSLETLKAQGKLISGKVIDENGAVLKLENASGTPATMSCFAIDDPGISTGAYAIRGQVRCDNVQGQGYLEMWTHMDGGGKFFTRTLGQVGPMKSIEGTSPWRAFELPGYIADKTGKVTSLPSKLQFNIYLPGEGTVYVKDIELVAYSDDEAKAMLAGGVSKWSSGAIMGLVFGLMGGVVGGLGGLISVLSSRGKSRGFVFAAMYTSLVVGAVLLVVGLSLVMTSKGFGVWYPFVLMGALCMLLPAVSLKSVKRRYEDLELRKMQAMDAG